MCPYTIITSVILVLSIRNICLIQVVMSLWQVSRLMNWSAWYALKRVCTFRVSGNPHQWGPQVDSALHCAGQRAQRRLSFLRFLCSTCGRSSVSATCARDDSIWINGISILCILSLEMITICKWGHFFYIRPLPHQLAHGSCQQRQGEHVRRPYLRSHSTTLYIMVYDRALQMCPV